MGVAAVGRGCSPAARDGSGVAAARGGRVVRTEPGGEVRVRVETGVGPA